MKPSDRFRQKFSVVAFSAIFLLLNASSAFAQADRLTVDYVVKVKSVNGQLFHVRAEIKNISEPRLDISLPTWSPGWYTIENYAKNVLRFEITDSKGVRLPHIMTKSQTWRVETKGISQIYVDFDYRANVLALNQAKITKDYAFFTGTELFVMADGHRRNQSTVHFDLPAGWRIISALKETSDPMTFTASDYDTLVDAPTEMGNFDVTKFEVEGKPHYFVSTPAGSFSRDKATDLTKKLAKIATADSAIFGGLPYEKYVYFYFFARPESNASGALEHLNSHVAFGGNGLTATPEDLADTAAHEYFHLWNVKRIRPTEMWPYDYSRENETPLLWVSEGFTNYYEMVAQYRAGLINRDRFIQAVSGAITGVESNDARNYISPAEASESTWVGYDTPVAFGISYYTQGQNLGALLDLSIRHDTAGANGLDDVMRSLYRDFYQKGKGFTTEDMIAIVNRLTKKDYHDFYNRYVWGVEIPDYEAILGFAGYNVNKNLRKTPWLGLSFANGDGGLKVTGIVDDSPAAQSGIEVGDIIASVDGNPQWWRSDLSEKIGQTVKASIRRGAIEKTLDLKIGSRDQVNYQITELPSPTPDQLKVREAWLKK
ncbi:MAG TPA: PDZ domain-containing protein [Blastocatellia bacterium]|nr:PDZ domain-containing protein [Blastocatellia bacterium]